MAVARPGVGKNPILAAVGCLLTSIALVGAARLASLQGHIAQPYVASVHLLVGVVACVGCAILTHRAVGWRGRLAFAAAGVLGIWFAVFLGVATHFDVWQRMPAPPSEAYADGAQLVATVVGGWIPGLLVYGLSLAATCAVSGLLKAIKGSRKPQG